MKLVWLVDDDVNIREAMEAMVSMIGYSFRGFPDARDATRVLLDGERPDLLLLDINMPEVTGMDLLKFIRSREQWNTLPILMLTSESSDESVEKAVRLGADGYVFKPVNFEELQIAVRTGLEKRRLKTGPLNSISPPTRPIRRKDS